LRKRPLAACLATALAIGVPAVVESAPSPASRPMPRPDRAGSVVEIRARLARHPSPSGLVVVANCNDSGPGSLRDAVANASDGAHVDLRSLACSTITLDSAIAVGAIDLYIDGPGRDRLTIDGGGYSRLFEAADHRPPLTG